MSICSRSGINFNKNKFWFAEDTVDYVGFTLTKDEIKPAASMTESIQNWSKEGQSLGLWQKHCSCKGPVTIVCCRGGWKIMFMSSRFNTDAQSRYSPNEGECLTLYWAINKLDYFLYGCDILFVGTDHRPLLAFFRKDDPKHLDHISNKRLGKYVAEIGELRFSMFHIEGAR